MKWMSKKDMEWGCWRGFKKIVDDYDDEEEEDKGGYQKIVNKSNGQLRILSFSVAQLVQNNVYKLRKGINYFSLSNLAL